MIITDLFEYVGKKVQIHFFDGKVVQGEMERTMAVDLDKMADRVAEKALDEFTYNGKTIREWVEIIVTAESVVEVRMVEEFEKLKAEIREPNEMEYFENSNIWQKWFYDLIDNRIKEIKGEKE